MKKKTIITAVAAAALVLSAGCVTAFAAGVDAETNEPKSPEAVVTSENKDEEAQAEESVQKQSKYSYITGQQNSTNRNDLYTQAEELPEDEQDAFLAENGIGETPWSEEAAASCSYVGGQQRGASYRQGDDGDGTWDMSGYSYQAGQQRGASYHK